MCHLFFILNNCTTVPSFVFCFFKRVPHVCESGAGSLDPFLLLLFPVCIRSLGKLTQRQGKKLMGDVLEFYRKKCLGVLKKY